ncbi:MAG: hypothetical protein ACI4TX_03445, partial [Christensenellales bacterium]
DITEGISSPTSTVSEPEYTTPVAIDIGEGAYIYTRYKHTVWRYDFEELLEHSVRTLHIVELNLGEPINVGNESCFSINVKAEQKL